MMAYREALHDTIRNKDAWLIPYVMGWAGLGEQQPWGAATSFALEVAAGYGLIKGESDATLTPQGEAAAKHLAAALRAQAGGV